MSWAYHSDLDFDSLASFFFVRCSKCNDKIDLDIQIAKRTMQIIESKHLKETHSLITPHLKAHTHTHKTNTIHITNGRLIMGSSDYVFW